MNSMPDAEAVARLFHESYERLAPAFGYETRLDTRVLWENVPERNKRLMIASAAEVLAVLFPPQEQQKQQEQLAPESTPSAVPDDGR